MVKCIKCGTDIPDDAEFCPKCHSVAAWSRANVKEIYHQTAASHSYQNVRSVPGKPIKDRFKLLWLLAGIIIVLTVGYYFLDKYVLTQSSSVLSPQEQAVVEMVRATNLLEEGRTTGEVLDAWSQTGEGFARIIGWKVKEVENSGVYLVTYNYDDDYFDANGSKFFLFEADTNTGTVLKADQDLIKKYRDMGLIESSL